MSNYDRWRKRLAGEKVVAHELPELADLGFYRKPIKTKTSGGASKTVGYMPVALFKGLDGNLAGMIGTNVVSEQELTDVWTWVIAHPVSEEVWRRVVEDGEKWPDLAEPAIPAANRDVTTTDNAPPEETGPEAHATAIENAKAAAPQTVTDADEAAKAAGSMNRLAELRLACDKAGQAIYKPLHAIYSKSQKEWTAPVKVAEAEEARLKKLCLTWQESERKRLEKEAEEAAAKLDVAATPEPVAAPAAIAASYGTRKVKAEVKKFAVINDLAAVLAYFKDDPELQQRAEKLATDSVRKGKKVPGTTVREGLV